ncbi:MAG: hypothetical protein NC293_08745 [Roseburia sp.]|nr:hypothetical protein [Roseburia sp.]
MERMASYVDRGNQILSQKGRTKKAIRQSMKMVEKGLQHYSEKILKAVNPYSKSDAGLVVIALRHIADEIEKKEGAEAFVKEMSKCLVFPETSIKGKIQKPNKNV